MLSARQNPNYGKGVAEAEYFAADELSQELEAVFANPRYTPPTLPAAAVRVASMNMRDATFRDVEKILETDPVLAGQVMRIANSPVYAGERPMRSLSEGLSRLGLSTVRDLVVQVALSSRVFRCKEYQPVLDALVRHSTAVAHATRHICRMSSIDAEYSFLCGLLHDVGIAGALLALAERPGKPPHLMDTWSVVHEVHCQAGEVMARQWQMPVDIQYVLRHHHGVVIEGYPHPVAAAVRLAGHFVDELGYHLEVECNEMQLPKLSLKEYPVRQCAEALNIDFGRFASIQDELATHLARAAV